MNIYEKMLAIQHELKAPKGQYNSFGKYSYRSCEDILEAVKPIAHKNNCVVQIADDVLNIGDRYYIKATAMLIDCETGDKVQNTAFAREADEKKGMDDSQVTGTASSYARKYALNGLFAIDDTKDADTDEHKKQTDGKKQAKQYSCEECGKAVLGYSTKDGKKKSAAEAAEISKKTFGRVLCADCMKNAKK